ncbi:MAG: hypothetical protein LBU72_02145 [Burkholderiaceae bacterium]|jgi:hypothetical protein|nr:hypothetical protein [Burkholderiaceae bacterium]
MFDSRVHIHDVLLEALQAVHEAGYPIEFQRMHLRLGDDIDTYIFIKAPGYPNKLTIWLASTKDGKNFFSGMSEEFKMMGARPSQPSIKPLLEAIAQNAVKWRPKANEEKAVK